MPRDRSWEALSAQALSAQALDGIEPPTEGA